MEQTKESIIKRVEDAIAAGGLDVLSYMHDALNTIEDWLKGAEDTATGGAAQAAVSTTDDTPAA